MKLINSEAILETERMKLEPLKKYHADYLYPLFQNSRIYCYIPQNPPTSLASLQQRYQKLESRLSPSNDEAWLNWAVRLKQVTPLQYVGRIEASILPNRIAEIAYEFAPEFWGHGYATEACQCFLQLLFADYSVNEALAIVDTRNKASICLLERLGFEQIGFQAEADFFKDSASHEYTYRYLKH
jgi:[ribosomal protein S5]-alanine N-acetyltransferase